jgi:hypothetical protein
MAPQGDLRPVVPRFTALLGGFPLLLRLARPILGIHEQRLQTRLGLQTRR